jgi:hypothetical protein
MTSFLKFQQKLFQFNHPKIYLNKSFLPDDLLA